MAQDVRTRKHCRRLMGVAIASVVIAGLFSMTPAPLSYAQEVFRNVRRTIVNREQMRYADIGLENPIGPFISEVIGPRLYMRALVQVTETKTIEVYNATGKLVRTRTQTNTTGYKKPFDIGNFWMSHSAETPPPFVHMLGNPSVRFEVGFAARTATDTYDVQGHLVARSLFVSGTDQDGQPIGGSCGQEILMTNIVTDKFNRLRAFRASTPASCGQGGMAGADVSDISYNAVGRVIGYQFVAWVSSGREPFFSPPKNYLNIQYNDLGDVVHYEVLEPRGVSP